MTESTPLDPEDAALVAAIRAGDPAPWGVIFDRYRDRVWRLAYGIVRRPADAEDVVSATFLKAVESIDQLRDPSAIRPWLLSIARRRSLDIVTRGHEAAHDPSEGDWVDQPSTATSDAMVSGLHQQDLTRLVAAAFDGLEPRDRAALELAEREELSGDELAASLDVTRDNAYQLLHNARDRFETSLSSLIVARHGRADCADLDTLLDGWDGELTPLLRKRLARHMKKCSTCSETRRLKVSPAALLALLPVAAMSTLAADQSRAAALTAAAAGPSTAPVSTGVAVGVGAKVGSAAVVALLVGGGAFVLATTGGADSGSTAPTTEQTPGVVEETEDQAVVAVAETTSTTTTTTMVAAVGDDFCTLVAEFSASAAAGPASGAAVDIEAYLDSVNSYLQRLVAASSPPTSELEEYAKDYSAIAKAGAGAAQAAASDPELAALRDTVEAQLADSCAG